MSPDGFLALVPIIRHGQDCYRTTLLAEETDPNKLHDLKAAFNVAQVYSPEQVQQIVTIFLGGVNRDDLSLLIAPGRSCNDPSAVIIGIFGVG